MPQFDAKLFNGEVFGQYVERVPNLKRNELIKSGALRTRSDLKTMFSAQTGSYYGTIPMLGLIDGEPLNYDGATDITATGTKTFSQSVIVVGRAKAWTEKDFSEDITGGEDFMANVGNQVAGFWDEVDQDTLLAILKGIYSMTGVGNEVFVGEHTYNITSEAGDLGKVGAATLNSAIQKACGDNKGKFSMTFMHSSVATNLENLNLVDRLKYTDENGIQRELSLGTWNGKTVIIDDAMPTREIDAVDEVAAVTAVPAVYTLAITTKALEDDSLTLAGHEYICGTTAGWDVGANVTADATALKALLTVDFPEFTIGGSVGNITLTQKTAKTESVPVLSVVKGTSGTLVATITETTEGVTGSPLIPAIPAYVEYTSYALGEGSFDYADVGAKVPYAMVRDEKTNGGETTLFSRQRKVFAPYGISFTNDSVSTNSPTKAELETGSNWELVNDGKISATYINHKAIPIARIVSRG